MTNNARTAAAAVALAGNAAAAIPLLLMWFPLSVLLHVVHLAGVWFLLAGRTTETGRHVLAVVVGVATGGLWWLGAMLAGVMVGVYPFLGSDAPRSQWEGAWDIFAVLVATSAAVLVWWAGRRTRPVEARMNTT